MIRISKNTNELNARVSLPASKSISNRLLILQFHYGASLQTGNLSRADDTILLASLLDLVRQYQASGSPGILHLDAHNAGSVFRFMTALLANTRGHYYLTGHERMKGRPVGPLVEALNSMGADVEYVERVGFAPLLIKGHILEGGSVKIDVSHSSQFLSALLLIAPMLGNGLTIEIAGPYVSWPYSAMTIKILEQLGVRINVDKNRIQVLPKEKISGTVVAEPDWSAASLWYCMLSMAGQGEVRFPELFLTGWQGDEALRDIFAPLGIITSYDDEGTVIRTGEPVKGPAYIDFTDYPDLAMPVILAMAVRGMTCNFIGLERLRLKESDRLNAMERELAKIGISLIQSSETHWQTGGKLLSPADVFIQDEQDHRIAMTFASLAMKGHRIFIADPRVVNKSYPGFWKDLASAGFEMNEFC